MIKMEVVNNEHFILSTDEKSRIEVSIENGKLIAHVYKGFKYNEDQEPIGAFDGHISNHSWQLL